MPTAKPKRQLDTGSAILKPATERANAKETRATISFKGDKSTCQPSNLRTIDEIDLDEIMASIREVFRSGVSLDSNSAITAIARVLGFRRTGNRIKEELRSAVRTAIRRHIIDRDKGVITIECATIYDYPRDDLIESLLAAMGSTWWDREDAIRAAALRLGFRRTSSRITKAFKSAINGSIRRGLVVYAENNIRRNTGKVR